MTMRVALDGAFLRLPPSGIGEYVRNLIPALQAVEPTLDLRVIQPDWDMTAPSESRVRSPLADRRVKRAAWELLGFASSARRVKPDLLHIPAFSAPLVAPCPFVVTIHDVIPFVLPAYRASHAMRLHLAAMRGTVRSARLVIAPSRHAAGEIASVLGIPPERIRVTHEAARSGYRPAEDRDAARQRVAKWGIDERYIFNVGGLDVRKNVPLLLEAFARLRPRLAERAQLVIAGAPHSENPAVFPPIQPTIDRLGIAGDVVLTGRISEEDKIALYQAADLYVTPSAYEGFGLTVLEAMACGVPTVAANRTCYPEIVGDGGMLVELDSEAIAEAMELVLTNNQAALDLRRRGIEHAATFSWDRTARQTLAVYQEAVHGVSKGASGG